MEHGGHRGEREAEHDVRYVQTEGFLWSRLISFAGAYSSARSNPMSAVGSMIL